MKNFIHQIRLMPSNFWYANFMEILERLAFFAVRAITPLFLVKEANENGLGLNFSEKGEIYMIWALIQCLLPMVSGGFTDRYGYRKSFAVAFTLNAIGYLSMANSLMLSTLLKNLGWQSAPYWVFLFSACVVATGTAIFKPSAHGTIAKTTDEKNSSLGWGIFYWMVNIGGALAPMLAAQLRGELNWHYVFYGALIVTLLNFIPAFTLYKEPEPAPKTAISEGPLQVFSKSISTIFKDVRLVIFLAIFSCFWLMFMQLWDLLPNFIDEWVNTSDVSQFFSFFNKNWILSSGQTKPEMIINLNPILIIILVIPISFIVGKMNKVLAMIIGMVISLIGFVGAGMTSIGYFCCLMILIFSIGEMTCSPTFQAYVGLIAPKDKKALYMGYSNIPFAVGWALGNKIGGSLYESMGSKINLAKKYLVEFFNVDVSSLKNSDVMSTLIQKLYPQLNPDILLKDSPEKYYALKNVNDLLWNTYHPYKVWYYLGAVGLIGIVGMIFFYFIMKTHEPSQ